MKLNKELPSEIAQLRLSDTITSNEEQSLVRSEMHMFLWPYFLLEKKADRFKMLEVTDVVNRGDEKIERKWQVMPHPEYGLAGPFDMKVQLALYTIAVENYLLKGKEVPNKMPIGSWKDLLLRIKVSKSGEHIQKTKDSLHRLMKTLCVSDKTFLHKSTNLYVSESFTVLKSIGIKGEKDQSGETYTESYVSFHPFILDNLNAKYLQILDNNLLDSLKTDIAKHLYPLLSYWFYRVKPKDYWRVEYYWLSNRLGIRSQSELWKARRQLNKAHKELIDSGYVSEIEWQDWTIIYHSGPVFSGEQVRRKATKPDEPIQLSLNFNMDTSKPDKLTPALTAWANDLPFTIKELKKVNLTEKQAETLCIERGIPITRNSQ